MERQMENTKFFEPTKESKDNRNLFPKSVIAKDKQKLNHELKLLKREEMKLEKLKITLEKLLRNLQLEELQLKYVDLIVSICYCTNSHIILQKLNHSQSVFIKFVLFQVCMYAKFVVYHCTTTNK